MAIEVLEQVPDVDVILVPVGGCGLIAGVSLAVKSLRPEVQVSWRSSLPLLLLLHPSLAAWKTGRYSHPYSALRWQ